MRPEDQPSNRGNGIVSQQPFENGDPVVEVRVGGKRSDAARADDDIRIGQGGVDENLLECRPIGGEQLVHDLAYRCVEPPSTSESIVAAIREQDRSQGARDLTMVPAALSEQPDNERKRVEYGASVVRSQAAGQKLTGPRRHRFHPVIRSKRKEWDFLTVSSLRQHLECGRADEALRM